MVYRHLTSRSLSSLCVAAIGLALACNPDKGDDSGSESTGAAPTSSTTDVDPTGSGTTGPTSGESTTGETTGGALACGDDPEFTASLAAWQAAVSTNGATYYYSVIDGFGPFGEPYCMYRTLVAVTDGVVVERRFEIALMDGEPVECETPFIEMGAEIGTHDVNYAAEPVTVDALYAACCDEVLHVEPAEDYTVEFTTDDRGFMKQCYHVMTACADGCDSGPFGSSLDFEVLAFGAPPAP